MIRRYVLRFLSLLFVTQILTVICLAERLPVKNYTTAEGLPRDEVTLIRRDSRGFLWIAAGDGISRFDGYRFANYTTSDGLADRRVNDLLETKSGVYWVATDGGLCRFNPEGVANTLGKKSNLRQAGDDASSASFFVTYSPTTKSIVFNGLLEDETGAIWCATNEGLYRLEVKSNGDPVFHLVSLTTGAEAESTQPVAAVIKDRNGTLWCAVREGLYRLLSGGFVEHYSVKNGLPRGMITSLFEDREGNIWAGTQLGLKGELLKLRTDPNPTGSIVEQTYGMKEGLASSWIQSIRQTRDGRLWTATTTGLYSITPADGSSVTTFQHFDEKSGVCSSVRDMAEDGDENLWVATSCGLQKVVRNGFATYDVADGLERTRINSIFENGDGGLFVISTSQAFGSTERTINSFDRERFHSVASLIPTNPGYQGWGWGQTIVQDHMGEWWVPAVSLFHFRRVKRLEDLPRSHPEIISTFGADTNFTEVFRLFEDVRGDMWIATTGLHFSLLRWERATGLIHDFTAETGVPAKTDFSFFQEDVNGSLWIGTSAGELLRYRDGRFKRFEAADGISPGWIIWLYCDHAGKMWIASQLGGLSYIENTGAESLTIKTYTTADGLSSNNIRAITEDMWGRIYAGTGHGVDRLDLQTGSVKHFTVSDGLPKGIIEQAFRDRQGGLWFGSQNGISRFVPEKQQTRTSPSIYLTGLRIEGIARQVSELGVSELPYLDLAPTQRQVTIDFVGIAASPGQDLKYQYYLEGAHEDWSVPVNERTVNFANLASGTYRFHVRVLDGDGLISSSPATFSFRIASPIWQRSWFIALIFAAIGLVAYSIFRYRLGRLLELERVRTRIATDLHDDIGSSLSQVSVLSEVISRRVGHEASVVEPLSTIATLSRDLVDSMSDIVWAIDPHRDRLSDLTQRMRRFASDFLGVHDIEVCFEMPDSPQDIKLGPDLRREIFLIFKEGLNNIVRHSGCASVVITLVVTAGTLELTLRDNGNGFDPGAVTNEGNGLANMRHRALKLNGQLSFDSSGDGTQVKLIVPTGRRRWLESRLSEYRG